MADARWFCGCYQRWKTVDASLELICEKAEVGTFPPIITLVYFKFCIFFLFFLFDFLLFFNNKVHESDGISIIRFQLLFHPAFFLFVEFSYGNFFLRFVRVLADGHIPWACEAFSKLHGRELVLSQALFWYFSCVTTIP